MTQSRSESRPTRDKERTAPLTFYRQVVAELRKVVWPTQQQLITYFAVVMVFVVVFVAIVTVFDFAFGQAVFALLGGDTTTTPPAGTGG